MSKSKISTIPKMDEDVEYKQLSDVEHVLKRPDMYMGNSTTVSKQVFTYDVKHDVVAYENVEFSMAVLKMFDEIFTNAVDNVERGSNIKNIDISITKDSITIRNDGKNTIAIKKCSPPNDNIYIPELIFTRLRSGSNFDDTKQRTYGGRNGIGSKLTAIFSSEFAITVCNNHKMYVQYVHDNCKTIDPPEITKVDENDFVMISFQPDFSRFDCDSITKDTYKVLCKRVHDCTHLPIQFTINGRKLPQHDWNEYVGTYPDTSRNNDPFITYEDSKHRWRIALSTSVKGIQTSTVNYVNTLDGGTHVDYILQQIKEYINNNVKPSIKQSKPKKAKTGVVKSKSKDNVDKKSNYTIAQLQSHMFVIVSAIVVNPAFKDQAKTELVTSIKEFTDNGKKDVCVLPEYVIKSFIADTQIIDELESKAKKALLNSTKKSVNQIEKYIRANNANPKTGYKCTLFVCEGLSAKTMCVTGMNIIGYDYYGVYPLRGKVLNTRNATLDKYCANREIQDLISIIGLEHGKEYTDTKGLNYGKIVCMKDADTDGAHIMGLVMNFFEHNFNSLVTIPGFFNEFITPMIQVAGKKCSYDFYNEVQYKQFMEEHDGEFKANAVRFIKGLASNTKKDIDRYFNSYSKFLIPIDFIDNYSESLDKAFNGKRTDDRKKWLTTVTPETHLPRESGKHINVDAFVDQELVQYALDDCIRTIPSVVDGLKPVQRKILYTMFNDAVIHKTKEIKVYELGGDVGKFAKYHHGEASLYEAIINMAQDYPGSNNLPLVDNSSDGFGTRQENGNDSGQPRYLTVKSKSHVARLIFPAVDDNILVSRIEDNIPVEPIYYIPIIPIVIINGAIGIGYGWSTTIPLHSVTDSIKYIRAKLNDKPKMPRIKPWYNDYDGEILVMDKCYDHTGVFEIRQNVVRVTELPITMSISKFRDVIVKTLMLNDGEELVVTTDSGSKQTKTNKTQYHISSYKSNVSRNINHIDIELTFDKFPGNSLTENEIKNILELHSTVPITNMTAFNKEEHIQHYNNIYEMVNEWFGVRYKAYTDRKAWLIQELEHRIKILRNKVKFIKENIEETLDYKNKSDEETDNILLEHEYEKDKNSFDYLLSMQVRSFTKDKYEKLCKELEDALKELEQLKNTTETQMWLSDLDALETAL